MNYECQINFMANGHTSFYGLAIENTRVFIATEVQLPLGNQSWQKHSFA